MATPTSKCLEIEINKKIQILGEENNKILTFATIWVDLESITLSELSERKTNTMCYHSYVESKE